MDIKENSLVILKDNEKTSFIKAFRKDKPLFNISVMGINEFKKKYYFDYTKEAIYYIHKKYNVIKSIAEVYLEDLIYIRDIDEAKVEYLQKIKKDLEDNNYLITNSNFKKSLIKKDIVLYKLNNIDNFYENMFDDLSSIANIIRIDNEEETESIKPIYKFPNRELEIGFVAEQIAKLIKSGIDINKIKIANLKDDYFFEVYNTFKDFNIPIELPSNESIESTYLVNQFKELYTENIEETLEQLKSIIKSKQDKDIYQSIINLLNEYTWATNYLDVKEFIFEDISKIKIPETHLKNAVRVIDFPNDIIEDDDYVFLINFNQGSIPVAKKDEDFLNDTIKVKLGMSNSVDINKKTILELQNAIKKTKNLTVTYIERNLNGELYISNAYDPDIFKEEDYNLDYTFSNNYNKRFLIKEKDEFRKYGTVTDLLKKLNSHYHEEKYLDYDNKFKGIDKIKLNKFLNNKLTLSYSSMNTFYRCAFRYYLDNIVKVNKFEDTFEITIGNIFHNILSKAFKENFDFEEAWEKTIKECTYEFNTSENFFLSILKPELEFIIKTINDQSDYTSLKRALYEQKIEVLIDSKSDIIFKGFVDKILYDEINGEKIVSIIDYKTGNPELNLDNTYYGLDMQLPIYAFLIRNYEPLKDAKVGGFYLQKILNNKRNLDEKINALKLQGYTNSNEAILSVVDNTYTNSKLIKSMKTTSNGLSSYAKVLSDNEIEALSKMVLKKIEEAAKQILNAEFDINPKEISGKQEGCKFCKYKDICFMKNKDIVKLKKVNKEEFLGGEHYANVD